MFCNLCLFDHLEGECENNAHDAPTYQPTRYAALEHAARVVLESLEWERKRSGTTYHGAELLREALERAD